MLTLNSYTETVYQNLITKLKDYCKCIPAGLTDKEIWNGGLFNIISLISKQLRWSDNNCNSFLLENRIYKAELEKDCCYTGVELPHFMVSSILSAKLYVISDCDEVEYEFLNPVYSSITEKFKICKDTKLINNSIEYNFEDIVSCCDNVCGCEKKYILNIEYTAGYNDIPDCLIPIICELYAYSVLVSNNCDMTACKNSEKLNYNAVLTSYTVGDSTYNWQNPNFNYENILSEFYSNGLLSGMYEYSNKRVIPTGLTTITCD